MTEVERLQEELEKNKSKAIAIMEALFSHIESQKQLLENKDTIINSLNETIRLKDELNQTKKKKKDIEDTLRKRQLGRELKVLHDDVKQYFSSLENSRKKVAEVAGTESGKKRMKKSQSWQQKFLSYHHQYKIQKQRFDNKVSDSEVIKSFILKNRNAPQSVKTYYQYLKK